MSILHQDLVLTFRRLFRAPGYATAVIISIALGIAANATIFSMVNRFVLKPAPVGDPSSLLALQTWHQGDECCNSFPNLFLRICVTKPNRSVGYLPMTSWYRLQ